MLLHDEPVGVRSIVRMRGWCALLVAFALPERRFAHVACRAVPFVSGSVIDEAQKRFLTLYENPLFLMTWST